MPYDPKFYEDRLKVARDPRTAVWSGTEEEWSLVKRESTEICYQYIKSGMKVLDAGCGIGELTECLPDGVDYLGIDYCKGFIEVANKRYPNRRFMVFNLLEIENFGDERFDIAVCRTVEGVMGASGFSGVIPGLLKLAPVVLVFRALLHEGGTKSTVMIHKRKRET